MPIKVNILSDRLTSDRQARTKKTPPAHNTTGVASTNSIHFDTDLAGLVERRVERLGSDGKLLPRFVTVANLESSDPQQVRDGNERVIRPRLADAAFFEPVQIGAAEADRGDAY